MLTRLLVSTFLATCLVSSGGAALAEQPRTDSTATLQQRIAALEKEVRALKAENASLRLALQKPSGPKAASTAGKARGSQYIGRWRFSTPQSGCVLDISANGAAFLVKRISGDEYGECPNHEGIYTLTPAGTLKGGPLDMNALSLDAAKGEVISSSGGTLRYLSRIQ
jgi:uncharacterized small protein (DUF1192 family)